MKDAGKAQYAGKMTDWKNLSQHEHRGRKTEIGNMRWESAPSRPKYAIGKLNDCDIVPRIEEVLVWTSRPVTVLTCNAQFSESSDLMVLCTTFCTGMGLSQAACSG